MSEIGSFPQAGVKIKNIWNRHRDIPYNPYGLSSIHVPGVKLLLPQSNGKPQILLTGKPQIPKGMDITSQWYFGTMKLTNPLWNC